MVVVVGGHSRNIGKTSVICGIIRTLQDLNWTALKISHDAKHEVSHVALWSEETGGSPQSDSGRFLAAGARRSFWVRTPAGSPEAALPRLREVIGAAENVIIESNSIVESVSPDVFLMVVDGAVADFKPSSRRLLGRADLIVPTSPALLNWPGIPASLFGGKPVYPATAPNFESAVLNAAIRRRCYIL